MDILRGLTLTDAVIILVLLFFTLKGMFTGFIREILGILGHVVAIVVSFKYYETLFEILKKAFSNPIIGKVSCFVFLYILIIIGFFALSSLLRFLVKLSKLTFLDRLLGAAFGFLKGLIICTVAFIVAVTFIPGSKESFKEAKCYPLLKISSNYIIYLTPHKIGDKFFIKLKEGNYQNETSSEKTSGSRVLLSERPCETR